MSHSASDSIFDKKLKGIQEKGVVPEDLLQLLAKVNHLQMQAKETAEVVLPKPEELPDPERRLQGVALVDQESFPHDSKQAKELFPKLLDLLDSQEAPLSVASKFIRETLDKGELNLDLAFEHYLGGGVAFYDEWAEKTPAAPQTLAFLIQSALAPGILRAAEQLGENLDLDQVWEHGHCPVCGGLPIMSELRNKEGQRYLTCGFCRTSYRDRRLACPYCGEKDQEKLLVFTVKEEPGYRVDVCKTCMGYIKTVDFRELDKKSLPLLDDLDSLSLDILAQKEGYKRPTLSGWGF